ncbi:MAG: cytidylate kinase-like family protein [Candidatus Borkfalkiaceae bacterium]|nr:cytidylate kinase-like family protein [Christensenellaceae bacterium]
MNKVITIGREFGSGGREFGRLLAEKLGYEYYDKEIITEIAKKTSLSETYVKQIVEQTPHSLFPITTGNAFAYYGNNHLYNVQSIFREQTNVITEMAKKSDCVIVGRCADYILEDLNPFKIFIYSDEKSKIERCLKKVDEPESVNVKKLKKQIKNIDKNRARYYSFYTGKKWGDKLNYDICINTSDIEIGEAVSVIEKLFE